MLRLLSGLGLVIALSSGCTQKLPASPVPPPIPSTASTTTDVTPLPKGSDVPGTIVSDAFTRECAPNLKVVEFSKYGVVDVVEKLIEDRGRIIFELTAGSFGGSDVPDIASLALMGDFSPQAVIVNSNTAAPLTVKPPVTIILSGYDFEPQFGKLHAITICYL